MKKTGLTGLTAAVVAAMLAGCSSSNNNAGAGASPTANQSGAPDASGALADGQKTFRFDTFGDEAFWGGVLKIPQAIEGSKLGGVGPGVSPRTALAVGLKVDVDVLPGDLQNQLKQGQVNLDDPAVTVALLGLNAVVGLTGVPDGKGGLSAIGIQCAVCHSRVDDSFAPGIGHRLDGWPNQDLDVGKIVSLSPDLTPVADLLGASDAAVRSVLAAWGPGRFDAELFFDGKGTRPDGKTGAVLIPPAFGLAGVNLHTWTGWGSVTYWNALVATLEMHGQGNFFDPRLDDAAKFPIAAAHKMGHTVTASDRVTPKLASLHLYQLAITAPAAPSGSFDAAAAGRGDQLFGGKARCAECHVRPLFTEPGWNMHTAQEIGVDDFQASRSPDDRYRTTPLRGLWTHTKRGFYHDGRFATLDDVVNHYDSLFGLGLSAGEKQDLVEYLKSI